MSGGVGTCRWHYHPQHLELIVCKAFHQVRLEMSNGAGPSDMYLGEITMQYVVLEPHSRLQQILEKEITFSVSISHAFQEFYCDYKLII